MQCYMLRIVWLLLAMSRDALQRTHQAPSTYRVQLVLIRLQMTARRTLSRLAKRISGRACLAHVSAALRLCACVFCPL
jgi:hypothetical protein